MHLLNILLIFSLLNFICNKPGLDVEAPILSQTNHSIGAKPMLCNAAKAGLTNAIFQSKDGGRTWEDISANLPGKAQVESFFVGSSEVYLGTKNDMYRLKTNSKTPNWNKDISLDYTGMSITFNRSGVFAFNYGGKIYQKIDITGTWLPVYTNFTENQVRTVFETTLGTLFIGSDNGLYKSVDNGKSWKQVRDEGWVMKIVESNGILMATGEKGIMRSSDNGENWDWVISEGGVGIDIESIDVGFAAITYNTVSKSRRVRISLNGGRSWEPIDAGLQAESISSIRQMGKYFICGHPNGILRSSDMGKTWQLVQPSIDKKVFRIYVSGSLLFAVPMDFGC